MDAEVRIDPGAKVSPSLRLNVWGSGKVSVRIAAGTVIEPGVVLRLRGGARVDIGPNCDLRTGVVLNVGGHLELRGENVLTWYSVVHCADHVVFEVEASCSEHASVVDSTHYRTDDGTPTYANSYSAPIVLGRGVWIAGKATVLQGVEVGDNGTVASTSVVTTSIPAGALAAGQPARVLRHDWTGAPRTTPSAGDGRPTDAEAPSQPDSHRRD